jgi:hypothetical protein
MTTLQAQAESTSWANPELYGHVVFDPPQSTTDAAIEAGAGDMYGSVLLDPLSKATTDAFLERGEGNQYGSVLLDVVATRHGASEKVASK